MDIPSQHTISTEDLNPEFETPAPQSGAMQMAYDVEADWHLLKTCNFRCDYCFFGPDHLGSKLRVFGGIDDWAEGFSATGKTWLLHLTGGEPTLYPGFADLCARLGEDHYLALNSNLSHRSILDFAKKVDPGRVHFVNAALHHQERQTRGGSETFIRHVRALQEHGFHVLVSAVMTPQMIRSYEGISADYRARGIALIPMLLQGKYRGKHYPRDYDPLERAALLTYMERAREDYGEVLARMGERPTLDMFSDDRILLASVNSYRGRLSSLFRGGKGDYAGRMCGAGARFVVIHPHGAVRRCSSSEEFGNILERNVRLLDGPKRCDTRFCHYYCEKYTRPPFNA